MPKPHRKAARAIFRLVGYDPWPMAEKRAHDRINGLAVDP